MENKPIPLTMGTFIGKVMALLFNILSAAAAAKSRQSCLTLWDPIDSSPTDSSVPGILQARVLEWGAIAFSDILSRLAIAFLPRRKHFNFIAAVTVHSDFGTQENKIYHCFQFSPFYLPWSDRTEHHDISFLNVVLSQLFTLLFHPHQEAL